MNFGEASGEVQNLPRGVRQAFGGSQNLPRQVRHVFGGSQKLPRQMRHVFGGSQKLPRQVRHVFGGSQKQRAECGKYLRNFPQAHSSVRTFAEVSASTPQYFLRPSRLPQKSKREIRSLYRRTSRFSQWRRRATSGPHLSYPLIYQWFRSPSARRRVVRPYHRSGNAV